MPRKRDSNLLRPHRGTESMTADRDRQRENLWVDVLESLKLRLLHDLMIKSSLLDCSERA